MKFSALDRQKNIYLDGFAGSRPAVPVSVAALEQAAQQKMDAHAFAYIAGGAGNETTLRANRQAFDQWHIVPRMLRDVSVRDTAIELFGEKLPLPLLLAPIGVLEMAHPEADLAVARAAAALGIPYIFSNQASKPMEVLAAAMGDQPHWFQLYWSKSNELVQSFVRRAERSGSKAIVVTLDTTLLGWRTRDLDLAYLPFLEGKGIAQYTSDPVFQQLMNDAPPAARKKITPSAVRGLVEMVRHYPGGNFFSKLLSGKPVRAVQHFVNSYSNPALQWSDLKLLKEITRLPILLKGILHPDDARRALDCGMGGIIVSNHGGRQVDGSISTLAALPAVVDAVAGRVPVLLDSGIRGGADMFKALALGANAVCLGRPYVYGLALAGQHGVSEVLQNVMADFELTMALAGCKNPGEINRDCLTR